MNGLLYKTNDDKPVKGKLKVYFTCHPDDLDGTLDMICRDIFATHSCAVFYRSDMSAPLENTSEELEPMVLFVYAVTKKLLTEDCPAVSDDLPAALQHGIKILPVVVEKGAGELPGYSSIFGTLQYLDRTLTDTSGVPYEKKLKDFLDRSLLDEETMKRIRMEFDAYVFLSYRKKDRRYANELMRRIHSDPHFLSIAVWYDEYLVPGEEFDLSIEEAMDKSKVFMLLVTPSLLERNDRGEKNYVQRIEYPKARSSGKPILPVEPVLPIEVVSVSRELLEQEYQGIPEVILLDDESRLFGVLSDHVGRYIKDIHDCSDRFYLLGMAYLNGYDVEINRGLGIELLSAAGEAGDLRAIDQLIEIYSYKAKGRGISGSTKYTPNALLWMNRKLDCLRETVGIKNEQALRLMYELATEDRSLGSSQRRELLETCLRVGLEIFPEDELFILDVTVKLAEGSPAQRYRVFEKAYWLAYKRYGDQKDENGWHVAERYNRFHSISLLRNLRPEARNAILQETYENRCARFGSEHRRTLFILKLMEAAKKQDAPGQERSTGSGSFSHYMSEEEINSRLEEVRQKYEDKQYPAAFSILSRILWACAEAEDHQRRRSILEWVCEAERKAFTNENYPPDARSHLHELATVCERLGDIKSAALNLQSYCDICRSQGFEELDSFAVDDPEITLAGLYHRLEDYASEAGLLAKLLGKRLSNVRQVRIPEDAGSYEKFTKKFAVCRLADRLFESCCAARDLSPAAALAKEHPVLRQLLTVYGEYLSAQGRSEDAALVKAAKL